jgi:amino acid permease
MPTRWQLPVSFWFLKISVIEMPAQAQAHIDAGGYQVGYFANPVTMNWFSGFAT